MRAGHGPLSDPSQLIDVLSCISGKWEGFRARRGLKVSGKWVGQVFEPGTASKPGSKA